MFCRFSIKFPRPQDRHERDELAPEMIDFLPMGHTKQFASDAAARVDEYFPTSQCRHVDEEFADLVVEKVPKTHSVHCVIDIAPLSSE